MKRFILTFFIVLALIQPVSAQTPSALETLANSLAPGQWGTLTTTDIVSALGGGSHEGNILPYAFTGAWDPVHRKMYFIGDDHSETVLHMAIYDDATNTWTRSDIAEMGTDHGDDHITIDPKTGTLYHKATSGQSTGRIYKKSLLDSVWTEAFNWVGYIQVAIGLEMWTGTMTGAGANGAVIVYNSGNTGEGQQLVIWDPLTQTTIELIQAGLTLPDTYQSFISYSEKYNCAIFGGGGANVRKVWRLNSDRSVTALTDAPSSIGLGVQYGNVAVDPVSGKFLVASNFEFWEFDPTGSGTWTQLADHPVLVGNPANPELESLMSFAVPNYGVVVYVTMYGPDTGYVHVYKHSTWPMTFDQKVTAQQGLVRSHVMASGDFNAWGNDLAVFTGAGEVNPVAPVIDSTVKASGKDSIKFTIPSQSSSGAGGQWTMRFATDNSVQFGAGDTFYVQWQQKFDRYMFEHSYALTSGSGGWKQGMIGSADGGGCSPSSTGTCATSCSALELVVQNTSQYALPQMYNNCGTFLPFQIGGIDGGSDVDLQPFQGTGPLTGGPTTYCSYQDRPSQGGTFQGCKKYSQGLISGGDQTTAFGTFTMRVWLGPVSGGFFQDSNVELWVSWGGKNPLKIIDYTTDLRSDGTEYGRVWFLAYHSGKDPAEVTTASYSWYANVIISTSPIPLVTSEEAVDCTPDHLSFVSQPSNAVLNSTIGTVSVAVRDSGESVCTDRTDTITLSKNGSATWGTLTTTSNLAKAAVSGVATWSTPDLKVTTTTGSGSIDAAASGLTGATSNSITISASTGITGAGARGRIRGKPDWQYKAVRQMPFDTSDDKRWWWNADQYRALRQMVLKGSQ